MTKPLLRIFVSRILLILDLTCSLTGNSMMTRKDSDLNDYWNEGMRRLKDSGEFDRLCAKAVEEHGM